MTPRSKLVAAVAAVAALFVAGGVVGDQALENEPAGVAAASGTIPGRGMQIYPGWLSTQDSPSLDATGGWFYPASPTTPYTAPNGSAATRYLLLDPRFTDSAGRRGNDDWWFIVERSWPDDYRPDTSDRDVNFHNAPGDAGNSAGAPGGIGWAPNFGSGVSALAFDYGVGGPEVDQAGTFAWRICVLCAWRSEGGFDAVVPAPRDGQMHTYVIHWVAGRKDGTTLRPGEVTVWFDGGDVPVLRRTNLNTVQRARSPADGQFYVQRWMVLWEGAYTIRLKQTPYSKRVVMTRIGRTYEEAVADRPTVPNDNFSSHYQAYGSFPRSAFSSFDRSASDAKLPPSLGGGDPDPDPPTGDFAWSPERPAPLEPVVFTATTSSAAEISWDFTLDGIADATGNPATKTYQMTGTKTVQLLLDGVIAKTRTLEVVSTADALPLHVVSSTSSTVTYGWTPPPAAAGYVFAIDGARVSSTFDGARSQVKFGKRTGTHVYSVTTILPGPKGDEEATR